MDKAACLPFSPFHPTRSSQGARRGSLCHPAAFSPAIYILSPEHVNIHFLAWNGRRQWHPTPVLLPGKSHGWRRLVGFSPWGREESDKTEWLHFHFSLSCIGEGNGNPLRCSCLQNPRDGGAWGAAVYGVAQSWTRLKRLSSSSRSLEWLHFIIFISTKCTFFLAFENAP